MSNSKLIPPNHKWQFGLRALFWITTGCAVATSSCVHLGDVRLMPVIIAVVGLDVLLLVCAGSEITWGVLVGVVVGAALFLSLAIGSGEVYWAQFTNFCAFFAGFGGAIDALNTRHRILGYAILAMLTVLFLVALFPCVPVHHHYGYTGSPEPLCFAGWRVPLAAASAATY